MLDLSNHDIPLYNLYEAKKKAESFVKKNDDESIEKELSLYTEGGNYHGRLEENCIICRRYIIWNSRC